MNVYDAGRFAVGRCLQLLCLTGIVVGGQLYGAEALAGPPVDGYPNLSERVVLYLSNRARTEPAAFNPESPYPPTHPLRFDVNLSKAARWQARHIIEERCWCEDHSSCCEVTKSGNDVSCAGSSSTCGVTSAADRIRLWSGAYSGENAAQGYTSAAAVIDGWISSPGHWQNMNSSNHTMLGPGQYQRGWVQVFGRGQTIPVAEDGIHFPEGSSFTFGSTYYQASTGGPRAALVIINGECHDLQLKYGTPEFGAFERSIALEPGCHRYYFHFTDGRGEDHTYPVTGSYAAASGQSAEQCPFYTETRPADTCSPSGQPCSTGDTRRCYYGPWGTEGVGQCKAGSERCIGGQWTGECREQVLPEAEEICEDGVDNTCNGRVDEDCSGQELPGDGWDGELLPGDDAGSLNERPLRRDSGCATVFDVPGEGPVSLMALLAFVCYVERRRGRA